MSPDDALFANLNDWEWRMNNLYWITSDTNGEPEKVIFRMTDVQVELFRGFHYKNIILKSRQHGITTFMVLFMLDAILFRPDINCGFVAHNREDAEDIFYKKVKYAYDNLPIEIRSSRPPLKNSGKMLSVVHKRSEGIPTSVSSLRVGTSLRSGTYSYIHISEFGKMCALEAQKSKEIISGCLNAGYSAVVTIESTAEGNFGEYYDICQRAEELLLSGANLTRMDYKFFFFPWYKHAASKLICEPFPYPPEMIDYFEELPIELPRENMDWYVKKWIEQGELMKQEYPSTPAEAFEQSMKGSFYAHEMRFAVEGKRIGSFSYNPEYPVHTAWDLGIDDYTVVWMFQEINGKYIFIDYFELDDRSGLPGAAMELGKRPYQWGTHIGPHDIKVTEFGTAMSRVELARTEHGIDFEAAPRLLIKDGIESVRSILAHCYFDTVKCATGLKHLRNYRKSWDPRRLLFLEKPDHDESSHGADAFRTFATSCNLIKEKLAQKNLLLESARW